MSYFPAIIFLLFASLFASGSSLSTDVEQDATDPKWKAMLVNFYKSGQITTNPDDIQVTRVILHHEHMWLLGTTEGILMTVEVNGGAPCILIINLLGILLDKCGITAKTTTSASVL